MTPLLQVQGLNKSFGGIQVSRNISMTLPRGGRVALIGPNGAGKTTFVNLLAGRLRPDAGHILLDGEDVSRLEPIARTRLGLVRSFQISRLFLDLSFADHVRLALLQRDGQSQRMFCSTRRDPAREDEVRAVLARLALSELADLKVRNAAYGQHRLLEIALALAMKAKVLLLDEPAAGVSRADVPRMLQAIQSLPADMAVLMIEHDLDFAFRFASHVVVLAEGAVIFEGTPREVMADAQVRSAYLGRYADRVGKGAA